MEVFAGPLFSIVLVILAGLALRYALWIGQGDQNRRTTDTIDEYEHRVRSLHQALEDEKAVQQKLRVDLEQESHDSSSLKRAVDERIGELKAQQKLTSDLECKLAEQSDHADSLKETIDDLRDQLSAANREAEEKGAQVRDLMNDRHAQEEHQDALVGEQGERISSLEAQLKGACQQVDELSQRLVASHDENVQLRSTIDGHLKTIEKGDERLDALLETTAVLEQERASLGEQVSELNHVRMAREKDHQRLQEMEDETRRLQETNKSQEDQITHWKAQAAELESTRDEVDQGQRALRVMSATVASLERQLRESLDDNEHLASRAEQAARLAGQLTESHKTIEQHEAMHADLREDNELQDAAMRKLRAENEALTQHLESTSNEVTFSAEQIRALTLKLESSDQQCEQLTCTAHDLQHECETQEQTIAECTARIRELETERDELVRGLVREQEERSGIDALHDQTAEELSRLQSELARFVELQAEFDRVESQYARETERVDRLTAERDKLATSLSVVEGESADLRRQYEIQANEKDQYRLKLSQLEIDLTDSEALVKEATDRRSEAERELASLTQLMAAGELQQEELRTQLASAQDRVESLAQEKSETSALLQAEQLIRRDLEDKLSVHAKTIDQLRQDASSLDSLLAQQRELQNSLDQHASRLSTARTAGPGQQAGSNEILSFADAMQGSQASDDPVLGPIYRQRPQRVDDLKLISGIGSVLEEKLNSLGVYTYEQIMHWTPEATVRFSELLSFKDRIERDNWLEQARRLYVENRPQAA